MKIMKIRKKIRNIAQKVKSCWESSKGLFELKSKHKGKKKKIGSDKKNSIFGIAYNILY